MGLDAYTANAQGWRQEDGQWIKELQHNEPRNGPAGKPYRSRPRDEGEGKRRNSIRRTDVRNMPWNNHHHN